MSVRELVFSYRESGARSVAKKDKQVRQSIQRTGRAARRNSGEVERWLQRSKKAIQLVAAASLAAVGAVLSASPTLRAELGGVRAAMTLFADTIVNDLLPAGSSLGSTAVDLAQRFRDLSDSIRRPISALSVLFAVVAGLSVVASGPVAILAGAFIGLTAAGYKFLSAIVDLSDALSGYRKIASGVARILQGDFSAGLRIAREGFVDLWRAGAETRQKVRLFITQMVNGVIQRLIKWRNRAATIATNVRDALVTKTMNAANRVLSLLDLARDLTQAGKEWVGGLASGVRARAGDLVDAFRSMASRVARAFKDRFNDLIPSSISIPSVTIDIPSALGGGSRSIGGGSLSLPQLNTGGRIASDGLAMLHAGERIMPAAQVRERGPQPTGDTTVVFEAGAIQIRGSGRSREDGQNVADEVSDKLGRKLGSRGA